MCKNITDEKRLLRERLRCVRARVENKTEKDNIICASALDTVRGNVMVYVSIGSEVNTFGLFRALLARLDCAVYAPYTDADFNIIPRRISSLAKADRLGNLDENCYYGATDGESADSATKKLDYCITPLLGFNCDGYRIGYGKGCYDRFLKRCGAVRVGLAYSDLKVNFAPEANDVPLDCCITEQKVIYFDHARDSRKI